MRCDTTSRNFELSQIAEECVHRYVESLGFKIIDTWAHLTSKGYSREEMEHETKKWGDRVIPINKKRFYIEVIDEGDYEKNNYVVGRSKINLYRGHFYAFHRHDGTVAFALRDDVNDALFLLPWKNNGANKEDYKLLSLDNFKKTFDLWNFGLRLEDLSFNSEKL